MEWAGAEVLIAAVISLTGLSLVVILLFGIFQKKKNYLIVQQIEAARNYEREVKELQFEIREQTLRNISWELHDNIGQLLTLAKIQIQGLPVDDETTSEISVTISNALAAIRALSKSINPEFIQQMSLCQAMQLEVDRMNRMGLIEARLIIEGEEKRIDNKKEVVLFRIVQEFISNTLKHAKASLMVIEIQFDEKNIVIKATDNGRGFNIDDKSNNGIGLSNIKKRAALIRSEIKFSSEIGIGTTMTIINPIINS